MREHGDMVDENAHPVAIITGGSRGIGLAIAEALASRGYRLVLAARDEERLQEAAERLQRNGATAAAAAVDLHAPGAATDLVAFTTSTFASPEVIVSNAGTAPTAKIEATDDPLLEEALALHVRVPLALARAVLPAMKEADRGCILHVASTAGLRGYPFTAAYAAAKHGMVGLARAFAAELAHTGIHAYALCPGFTDTDITRRAADAIASRGRTTADQAFSRLAAQNRIGRMHTVDEVAAAAAHLIETRPNGCVFDLDREHPDFVDIPE